MKRILRKCTPALLAFIMCAMTIFGTSFTAYAIGEKEEVIMIAFPREGDINYGGDWSHSAKSYMNGWRGMEGTRYVVYTMGSWNGNICYCIEPGAPLATGDSFVSKDESYWDNYPSDYNKTITPYMIKLFIGRIMQYGYTGEVSTAWRTQNPEDAGKLSKVIATQLLVWETIVGERDSNFNHVSPEGFDSVLSTVSLAHPLYAQIMNYYNSIAESVKVHATVPSFCSSNPEYAKTIELTWNGTNYSTSLTDTNGVLANYSFSADEPGIRLGTDGNTLTVSADSVPKSGVTITATKVNSMRKGIIVWDDGVISPSEGRQTTITYAQSVNDPVSGVFRIKVNTGSAWIKKVSEDGKVGNISFTIVGNGINETVTTDANGDVQTDNLVPGVYTVTELEYDLYEPQESRTVTVVSGETAKVTFNNVLKRGDVSVIKGAEDNFVEGITFRLYGTSQSGIAVNEYTNTDKNGLAVFKDVLVSGDTPYTLEEVDTAARYVVPEKQTAPVKWKEVTDRSFVNVLKKFSVTVTKKDSEKESAQGDASLAGAKYGLFDGDILIDEYFTDENGMFTTKEYECKDSWTIRELVPSKGYLLDPTIHPVGADEKLYEVEHNLIPIDVEEDVVKGKIAIIKHTDDGETKIETPEKGAEFAIYLKAAKSYEAAKPEERDVIVCDENGFGKTKELPYGMYTVHQTKGWKGREMVDDFDVFVGKDEETYHYIINNKEFESYVKVVKVDAETQKTIPYAGAGFKIYNPNGELVTMSLTYPSPVTFDTFYTDASGALVTPEKLPYGKGYSLVEVQAPFGYVLDPEPVYFDITEENSSEEGGVIVTKVNKENSSQKGTITIEKTGEVFQNVTALGGSDCEGNGLPVIFQPHYALQGLAGAVFEIRAAEDIATPDGTLRASKGEKVATLTTDEKGFAKSGELYLGKYEVQEIKAPHGMVLNSKAQTVELLYAGQNVSLSEATAAFSNDRQRVEISLIKTLELNELFGIGNNGEIRNIRFGLFAAGEIVSADGSAIPKDGLIEILSVDEKGKGVFRTDLPHGSYYVMELETDRQYILDDTKYPVVFEYAGQDTAKVVISANDGKAIENDMIYGRVSGRKTTEDGKALEGALMGLFKDKETEFAKENAIMTTISKKDGSFSFEQVPYGAWLVREIEQPEGFVLNDKVYSVTIGGEDETVEIEIENSHVRGNIALTKVDADYPDNTLQGAVFEVHMDTNNDGKQDENDELIGILTEKENGVYEMRDLLYGRYFVRETIAPEGFVPDENVYEVFIDTDGKTYFVENEAGEGFVNDAKKGSLKVVKTSSDKKVKGFAFRITGPNNYDVTLETDENGEIFIEGLRIGEYTVSEVNNAASAGYILPEDKTLTIKEDATTVVKMHNDRDDIPETGDTQNPAFWILVAVLTTFALGACKLLGDKRRKK